MREVCQGNQHSAGTTLIPTLILSYRGSDPKGSSKGVSKSVSEGASEP